MPRKTYILATLLGLAALTPAVTLAQGLTIDWSVVAGGGGMWSAGNSLTLSGTVGQPCLDTSLTMNGPTLTVTGGFWAGINPYAIGDMNCDGYLNFDDINPFVTAVVGQGDYEDQYPDCHWLNADTDHNGVVNFDDIEGFVNLLAGT